MKRSLFKVLYAIVIFFILPFLVMAQPSIEWEYNYGGTLTDQSFCIEATSDGGYIIAGGSSSFDQDVSNNNGSSDMWVVKIDQIGNIEWEKNFGGTIWEQAFSIKQTNDGGYIMTGEKKENFLNSDVIVIKLDNIGNVEWEQIYGGTGNDIGHSILKTSNDDGYLLVGSSDSSDGDISNNIGLTDIWVVKIDEIGNIEWENNYGDLANNEGRDIKETDDGGYIIAGNWSNGYIGYAMVVKIDSIGNLEWEKNYGGSDWDSAYSILHTNDSGYIFAGSSTSDDGDLSSNYGEHDAWVVKLDEIGNIEWEKNYGGSDIEESRAILETNGGYIFTGFSRSSDVDVSSNYGETDTWVVKLDEIGNIEWEKNYGGSDWDSACSMVETEGGGYVIAGLSRSSDIDVSSHYGENYENDIWVLKLMPFVSATNSIEPSVFIEVFPNPSSGNFHINIDDDLAGHITATISDINGTIIQSISGNITSIQMNNVPKGVYVIQLFNDIFYTTKRVLVH